MYYNNTNIKNIRINRNESQKDIAALMGITRSSYAMWESNYNLFPIKRLLDFCYICNSSLDYALGLSDNNLEISTKYDVEKFKKRFKELHKDNNLSQEKLANILKTSKSVISGYQTGRYVIATPFLYTICKKYNISADYLLGRIDSPKHLQDF